MVLILSGYPRYSVPGKSCFRPLAGIMVLINLESDDWYGVQAEAVSVPLRGLWFLSRQWGKLLLHRLAGVSVPLRGLWFLSIRTGRNLYSHYEVSVPLRGLWFLSKTRYDFMVQPEGQRFRPLAGIMVLIPRETCSLSKLKKGFRPLAGIMVLISLIGESWAISRIIVSVPLRGLWFLSTSALYRRSMKLTSFRPLAGIMVLIRFWKGE